MTSYPSNVTQGNTNIWQQDPSTQSQLSTTPILVHYTKPVGTTGNGSEPLPLSHYGPPMHTTNSQTQAIQSSPPAAATVQYTQYGVVHRTQLPHFVTVSPHVQNSAIPSEDFVPVQGIIEHC